MWEQISFYNEPPLKIHNTVRLIELFSGIGAQAKAFERLGVPFESYRSCEIDKYAVMSYNAVHGTNFVPTDITKLRAEDLGIVDRDEFTYLLTYSFPCQDLSIAGHQKGMAKGSGTRSGLLWEVERLLRECGDNLPQILVMENVKQVISKKNKPDFDMWRESLSGMGYQTAYQVLNAKDYGVAQNRERCFMVSWLGDYTYEFPKTIPLVKRLRDYLEDEVDEKYYLSEEQIATFVARSEEHKLTSSTGRGGGYIPMIIEARCHCVGTIGSDGFEEPRRVYGDDGCSPTITTRRGGQQEVKIMVRNANKKGYEEAEEGDFINLQYVTSSPSRGRVGKQVAQTLCCSDEQAVVVDDTYRGREPRVYDDFCPAIRAEREGFKVVGKMRIRKLTPLECWRLMDFDDEDFYKAQATESNTQLYAQAGNSIVVNVLTAIFGQLFDGKEDVYKEK